MSNVGYQDWQRVQYASGSLLDSGNKVVSAPYTSPVINVQNWNQLVFNMYSDDSAFHYVDFNWYETSALGLTVMSSEFGFAQFPGGVWVTTVKAPYVQYTINPGVGTFTFGQVWSLYGSVPQFTSYQTKGAGWQNMSQVQALAANQVLTSAVLPWYEGRILIDPQRTTTGACKLEFLYHDPNGNSDNVFYTLATQQGVNANPNDIWFPPYHVKVRYTNGATAQTVNLGLIPAGP